MAPKVEQGLNRQQGGREVRLLSSRDLAEVEHFRNYCADLYRLSLTPKEFAQKWANYMEVTEYQAEAYCQLQRIKEAK